MSAARTPASEQADGRMREADDSADGTDSAAPLDLLLGDAARSPLRRFVPGMSGVRFTTHLARRPGKVAGRTKDLAVELARVGVGRSALAPHEKDRRFTDDGWAKNPMLRRTLQTYLAVGETARGLVEDAELDWGDDQRIGFIVDNLVEASAPSNNPFLNPKVLKRIVDTGGGNLVEGGRRFVRDFASAPRVPSMVEPDAFEVGTDIAVTPGAVVLRTDMFELIQYTPQTPKVRTVPLLIVPPTINKYYVIDLAAERSLVEHLVANGQQVYCISWRNPDARHADWGVDSYGQAIIEAMDAAQKIARADQVALFGICSGGMLSSMVMGHLAAVGELDRVAAFSLAVTVLDQEQAGLPSALLVPQGRRGLGQGVAGEGLPRRALARRGVRLAASQRPDLELLGQQLPARPRPQGVRHPLLERRPGPDDRGDAPRLHGAGDLQRADPPGRRADARQRRGPRQGRHRLLRRGRHRRPPLQVGVLLPHHAAARRAPPGSCCPPAATSPRW